MFGARLLLVVSCFVWLRCVLLGVRCAFGR